jgi:hypothetical protein
VKQLWIIYGSVWERSACRSNLQGTGSELHHKRLSGADGWCWFVLREKYCWLFVSGWFVLRQKYCWLVADKPSEQDAFPSDWIPTEIDKYNKKIMIVTTRDMDLLRVEN